MVLLDIKQGCSLISLEYTTEEFSLPHSWQRTLEMSRLKALFR